ncbi:MAG: hypothetical protein WC457_04485 [Patescibacteria group bacterium]
MGVKLIITIMSVEKFSPSQETGSDQEVDLFFDGIGDLPECEKYLSNEIDPKTGQPWLDVIFEIKRASDGKIIEAKIKDPDAKVRFVNQQRQLGARRAAALGKNSIRNYGVSPWKRNQAEADAGYLKPEEEIDLAKFTELLESKIEEDVWARDVIRGWNLIPISSKKSKEPIFKLVVEFNDYGRKLFQGTHKEIEDGLNAELDRIEDFERGEAAEE